MATKALALFSGGMDSATLVYWLMEKGYEVTTLGVNYGQRHAKELKAASDLCAELGLERIVIALPDLAALSNSALTGQGEVPDGHYAEESMRQTVVPFRNPLMLSAAMAIGSGGGYDVVAAAVHAGDHYIYPDCRPEFIRSFDGMAHHALTGMHKPRLLTPFLNWTKAEIATDGSLLEVPWHKTWSCYKGGEIHCGRCGTCVERLEALHKAYADDQTRYEDTEFWKQAVQDAEKKPW